MRLNSLPLASTPVDVVLWSRYEDAGLTDQIPRELVFEVHVEAEDAAAAVAIAGAVGSGLAAILSVAVNAYVPAPSPYLAFEASLGLTPRKFWQRHVTLTEGMPRLGRLLNQTTLFPMLEAIFASREHKRLGLAVGQYHVALSHWTISGMPLALAHLYMGLEALGPVFERSERARLGLDSEREHAEYRDVDVDRKNWKDVLLGWIRRDVICKGDKATYDAARNASNGFEHGSMSFPEFQATAKVHGRPLLDYLREGLLAQVDLTDDVRDELLARRPIEVSPLWLELRGELHGSVEDPDALGKPGEPFPFLDWNTTLGDARRLEDGRLQFTPTHNLTLQCAEGVSFTPSRHAMHVGLSDADLFDHEPPETGASLTNDG